MNPTDSGAACATEFQNASGVCPDKQAAGTIGDGAGDHHRYRDAACVEFLGDGENCRLGVKRVENRLDQQRVDAAVEQPAHLLRIGDAQLIEGDGAEARIENIGRYRSGAVGRADGAGDEPLPAVLVLGKPRGVARQSGAFEVQLVGNLRHAVIGLCDACRGECIGRDDVGAGAEIGEVDRADGVRPGEYEQIVVAAHLAVPGIETRAAKAFLVEAKRLDHRAHGAVEHQNALSGELPQRRFGRDLETDLTAELDMSHTRSVCAAARAKSDCRVSCPA